MRIAVCVWVRDEAIDLPEWVAFHAAVGFDAAIVIDNGSVDGTPDVARALARHFDVRLEDDREHNQGQAYYRAAKKHAPDFDWIAFVDSDEFVVPKRPIKALLAARSDASAIAVNWAIFGSSGVDRRPSGLVTETFLQRAPDSFGDNRNVKSFVRPSAITAVLSQHTFDAGRPYVSFAGRDVTWLHPGGIADGVPDYSLCQINHYFIRSLEHWEAKMARGYRDGTERDWKGAFDHFDRNDVFDDCALGFVPDTKTYLARFARVPLRSRIASWLRSGASPERSNQRSR